MENLNFKKVADKLKDRDGEEITNVYGYDAFEILAFNYDGEGNALGFVTIDGKSNVELIHKKDLDNLMGLGEPPYFYALQA